MTCYTADWIFGLPLMIPISIMFPYAIAIPKDLQQFVPELHAIIMEWDCKHAFALKDGCTMISVYFPSSEVRNDFIATLNSRVPMCAGLGTRLLATNEKKRYQ